jgi:poly(A) polymerase
LRRRKARKLCGDIMAEPTIISAPPALRHEKISIEALKVIQRLQQSGYQAYVAGGGVRDLLLGRHPKDFDIATSAHPNEVRRVFHNCRLIGRRFRLAHVLFRGLFIEVATFRATVDAETDEQPEAPLAGRNEPPEAFRAQDGMILRDNVYGTAEQDAWRRDFTVNALFYDPQAHKVIDYCGGLPDLERRILRSIGDPFVRFREDPVRMLRACRFAGALDFQIEPHADHAISQLRDDLARASPSRMYEEVLKLFNSGAAEAIFRHLHRTGLFKVIFPEAGDWFATEEGEEALLRVYHALRQMDVWKKHGHGISAPLAWALAFGPYHEHRAALLQKEGMKPAPALAIATTEHLRGLAKRVQVFKWVVRDASLLMAAQPVFEKTREGARTGRFRTRHYFGDALVYLKLRSAWTGQGPDLVHWWQQHL